MESEIYKEILEIKDKLDKKFEQNAELENRLNKTDSLNTYLFSNPPEELKRSKIETEELIKNIQGLSKRLGELGFVINGRDYSLECFDNRQMRVESAKYGFVVQYRH